MCPAVEVTMERGTADATTQVLKRRSGRRFDHCRALSGGNHGFLRDAHKLRLDNRLSARPPPRFPIIRQSQSIEPLKNTLAPFPSNTADIQVKIYRGTPQKYFPDTS